MKYLFWTLCIGLCFLFAYSCMDDDSVSEESKVIPEKTTVAGKIGDVFEILVCFGSDEISQLVITKSIDGVKSDDYIKEVTVKGTSETYLFSQLIEAGDEEGILVYTLSGYDRSKNLIDASDIKVSVTLGGMPLLVKYDWKLMWQTTSGDDTTISTLTDNIYRFNKDYTWQFDWGEAPTLTEELRQYCSWKIGGSESQVDSLYLVYFNFLAAVPTLEGYKVIKLEGDELWIETTMDLSWLGLSEETQVIEKYTAVVRSSDFTPYRNRNAGNYTWGDCQPGTY